MKSRVLFSVLAVLLAATTVLTVSSCNKNEDSNDIQNTAPKASFTVSPSSGTTDTQFEFDASACNDKEDETSTLEVRWDWENDGSWDTDWSSNKIINHKFNTEGEYTVVLEVKDSKGLKDSETHDVNVQGGGGGNTPPTAIFSVSPTSGSTSTSFEFDASDSYDNEDPTSDLQVRWDFDGDGSWDSGWDYDKTENHQYSAEGIYTAKMEVKDTEELTDYTTQSVTVDNGGGGNGCDGQTTLIYGGQTYDLVEIGDQCWMAENLNYETGNSWCYDDNSSNCETYGRLYDWSTALDACPSGWHLPSDDEWCTLTTYIDPTVDCDEIGNSGTNAGYKMKSTSGWYSNGNGSDAYGFAALPGGGRYSYGSFGTIEKYAYFWSSTENGTDAWLRYLLYNNDEVGRNFNDQDVGLSVRCLKD